MTKSWWWVIGGLTALQAPYWAMIVERAFTGA
jgi:hypothetical protein